MAPDDNELLAQRLDQMEKKLDEILTQAKQTNGRVTELEKFRERVLGALIPIAILAPIASGLIVGFLTKS